jgi:penicillin-binding protein 2
MKQLKNIFEPGKALGTLGSTNEYEAIEADVAKNVLEEEPRSREFPLLGLIFGIGLMLLVGKLVHLQVAENARNRVLAEGNRIRAIEIPAPRGAITDRRAAPLVRNVSSFVLEIFPTDLPRLAGDRRRLLAELNQYFPLPPDVRTSLEAERVTNAGVITLSTDVPRDAALMIETKIREWPGVRLAKNPRRLYEPLPGFGTALGYTGKVTKEELAKYNDEYAFTAFIGKTGLEKEYEQELKGVAGREQVEVDSRGKVQRQLATIPARLGNALRLHLDLEVQKAASTALSEMLKTTGSKAGAAVALDPRSGAVRALVSFPSYDPNSFAGGLSSEEYQALLNDPSEPLLNRATSGQYESGSTIKPFVFTAGLSEKVITPQTAFDTPSEIRIGEWVFPDWKDHGLTDVRRAIAESNNIFAFTVGGGWDKYQGLGPQRLTSWLSKFGFGEATKIDLPSEQTGFVPTPDWKKRTKGERWYIGDTYNLSIGQGDFLTTPVQMATAIGSIANGGTRYAPRLADAVLREDGSVERQIAPDVIEKNVADEQWLKVIREGMRQTITEGSGRAAFDGVQFSVAGKTGTAQHGNQEKTHAWFVGFAPYENPEIVVIVIVEDGGEGHAAAAPVARAMLEAWWRSEHP